MKSAAAQPLLFQGLGCRDQAAGGFRSNEKAQNPSAALRLPRFFFFFLLSSACSYDFGCLFLSANPHSLCAMFPTHTCVSSERCGKRMFLGGAGCNRQTEEMENGEQAARKRGLNESWLFFFCIKLSLPVTGWAHRSRSDQVCQHGLREKTGGYLTWHLPFWVSR